MVNDDRWTNSSCVVQCRLPNKSLRDDNFIRHKSSTSSALFISKTKFSCRSSCQRTAGIELKCRHADQFKVESECDRWSVYKWSYLVPLIRRCISTIGERLTDERTSEFVDLYGKYFNDQYLNDGEHAWRECWSERITLNGRALLCLFSLSKLLIEKRRRKVRDNCLMYWCPELHLYSPIINDNRALSSDTEVSLNKHGKRQACAAALVDWIAPQ